MNKKAKDEGERLNLTLPPKIAKKLNGYCLRVANKRGKMPHGIKTTIGRMALDEWLETHKEDINIKF